MSTQLDQVVTLRGEQQLVERAGHLFSNVQEEFLCAAADLSTWSFGSVREAIRQGMRARTKGVATHKLFTPRALDDEESEHYLVDLAGRDVQVRISTAALPHETIMIDRRVVILAGAPVAGVRTFSVIQSPDVIQGLSSLFWATWSAATSLEEFRRDRAPALSDESREILRCLSDGMKDETAAKKLGLSLRTYRRRVAELMILLGATSRFQAGVRARELKLG